MESISGRGCVYVRVWRQVCSASKNIPLIKLSVLQTLRLCFLILHLTPIRSSPSFPLSPFPSPSNSCILNCACIADVWWGITWICMELQDYYVNAPVCIYLPALLFRCHPLHPERSLSEEFETKVRLSLTPPVEGKGACAGKNIFIYVERYCL